MATLLTLLLPRAARGEDSLTYKFQSWQEDGDRIRVDSHYALAEKDLTPDTRFKLMGLIDSIAGATPSGERATTAGDPVPLSHMEDERKAWDANLAHQFKRVNVAAGFGISRESDYVSRGWSVNTLTDFNQKNTTLLLGYGRTDDRLNEYFWSKRRFKTGNDFVVGVTQLIDPNTAVTANLSFGKASGFMSDPYKIVSTTRLDLDPGFYYTPSENRPREKEKWVLFLGANRNFERLSGALDASYRFYHDSFGIDSHTVDLRWIQKLGARVMVSPSLRFYRQSAADFYFYNLDAAGVVTSYDDLLETGTGTAPFYSSDHRLSRMQTINLGLKVVWTINAHLSVDAAYERYLMKGLDSSTPKDSFADADVFTVGVKITR